MVSQVLEVKPKLFMVADYSKPGYWLIDTANDSKPPVQIIDTRDEHNSGCTDL